MDPNKSVEIVENVLTSKNNVTFKYNSFMKSAFAKLKENENRIAMIDCDTGKQWSAYEMIAAVERFGIAFLNIGVSKGDVVFFYCRNNDLQTVAMLAVWAIGAVYSGSLHNNPLREVQNLITVSGAVYLVGCNENIEICSKLMSQHKQLKKLFLIDGENEQRNAVISLKSYLNVKIDSRSIAKFYEVMSKIKLDDLLKVNFSSGTTGQPKGASLTNANLLSTLAYPTKELITDKDIVACTPHYCHAGRSVILAIGLLQGSQLIVMSEFEYSAFITLVQKYSITVAMLVPAVINLMNKTKTDTLHNFSLRTVLVTGEILPQCIAAEYIKKFEPSYFGQLYGSTEMITIALKPKSDGITNVLSVGLPIAGANIKIIDISTGKCLDHNKIGEIFVKGPQLSPGYFNNVNANKQSYDENGFFKTGDLGYYNEYGYLFVTDRIKETMKYNSQQVSPYELESILLSHGSVKEVAVIGVHDEVWGQLPKAFVVLKEEFRDKVTAKQLIEFVDSQVSDHKRLRGGVVFLDELKKTVIGKVDRKALKLL